MIEFKNVGKIYPNGVDAIKDVILNIEQGEFITIIGLSGAGKFTLLGSINQMHPITSVELNVNGQNVSKLKGKELRKFSRNIGRFFNHLTL